MKRETVSEALNLLDERHIRETAFFDPAHAQSSPERIESMKHKRVFSILLAAALILTLSLAAYAVGSIHLLHQSRLREDIGVDENPTGSYVEYDSEAEPSSGAVLLSAINDGQEQRIYVDVFPVAEDELALFPGTLSFGWLLEGTERGGYANPSLRPDRTLSGYEALHDAVLEDAYDAEAQTLTLVCYLPSSLLLETMSEQGRDSVCLSFAMADRDRELRRFGPITFTPTEEELRCFDFSHARFLDPESGCEIEILGLELTPLSAIWRLHYEGDAVIHTPEGGQSPEAQAFLLLEDRICMEALLVFSDGSSFSTGGALMTPYRDGEVREYCGWGRAIDIHDVQRIVLGDLVLWENK